MTIPGISGDLERRKQVRLRLRPDLEIEPQKYEGRTYWVVKDPVSLRYFRFKEQEYFLLQHMNGSTTLEEAQKAFEQRFRPDRLTLEDLEGFAQQLLTAGLAQNESPRAGQQLFDRRKKRRKSEITQALTNILYIKLPIFDPDKLLKHMLVYLWWIFSIPFLLVSVGFMLSAIMLVATHFQTFREKLPDYHSFFQPATVVYLWIALGAVKIIHEFGHGLSCKAFGGEVHEMGALFLCFSPCLYANVSDAWTLPSKWKRIIISAAGIYVELLIAAGATFVWWNSSSQPFVQNLSLSLMVVCSVSTVVFNANPLMRYDGYYVLADWLEIPNLRDRANKYISRLAQHYFLGIEVQPEPYMAFWRRVLFVVYAAISYVYRWIVTFSILYFMYNWLKPYKLGVVSSFMALFAAGSMVGWPLYRLGQNIYKRGRLPDMKPIRVFFTTVLLSLLLIVIFTVPLPISRIRQSGLIEVDPSRYDVIAYTVPGRLEQIYVRDRQFVESGQTIGLLSNFDLENELERSRNEHAVNVIERRALEQQWRSPNLRKEDQDELHLQLSKTQERIWANESSIHLKTSDVRSLEITAKRSGWVFDAPQNEELGKMQKPNPQAQFCKIGDPRRLRVLVPLSPMEYHRLREDLANAQGRGKELGVTLRVQGMVEQTWQGRVGALPDSIAKEGEIPPGLVNKYGGPIAVKANSSQSKGFVPQSQQYLVPVEILDSPDYLCPGSLAQVKIHCRWRTIAFWLKQTIYDLFDVGLI